MEQNKNDIIYTAKDIEQYLSGKLSPLEMHEMEKAALDDDFLAEAIEGYAAVKATQWEDHLSFVRGNLDQQYGAKIIPIQKPKNRLWKAAAAVLIIGTAATIGYTVLHKREGQQIAQNINNKDSITANVNPSATTSNEVIAKTEAIQKSESDNNLKSDVKIPVKANPVIAETGADDAIAKVQVNPVAPSAPVATESKNEKLDEVVVAKADSNAAKDINSDYFAARNKSFNNVKSEAAAKKAMAEKPRIQANNYLYFKAQIVGADGNPLPFSNINIKDDNIGTYADIKGNFILVSTDSLLTVDVKSVGYKTKTFVLKSNRQQDKLVLNLDENAFKKTTVIGNAELAKSKLTRKSIQAFDSSVNVEPLDGWDKYNIYVANNLEIPDEISSKGIHGQVNLSFDVLPSGAITNIRVDKSLCSDCDEAAKKIIQKGPQWVTKSNKTSKGKVTVQF